MRNILQRLAAALIALSLVVAPNAPSSGFGLGQLGAGMGHLGALAGKPQPYMIASNRLTVGQGTSHATLAAEQFFISKIYAWTGKWAAKNGKFLLSNTYSQAGTITNPGNVLNIEKMALWINGVFICPITVAGSRSVTLANGQSLWTDSLASVVPANTQIELRIAGNVALNDFLVGSIYRIYNPVFQSPTGEAFGTSSTSEAGLVDTGTILAGDGSFGTGSAFTFSAFVAQGWDGSPAALVLGDSRVYGDNANANLPDAYLNYSGLTQGLFSPTNGRIPMWNTSMFSANMNVVKGSTLNWVAAAVAQLPNVPFNIVVNELGINDLGAGSLAAVQTIENTLISNIQTNFPGVLYYNTTIGPETNSTTAWTDETNQTYSAAFYGPDPSVRSQLNAWRLSVPIGVKACLDGESVLQGTPTSFWLGSIASGTITSSITANTSAQFQSSISPPLGTYAVFEVGAGNQDSDQYQVAAITGSGPFTISVNAGISNQPRKIQLAHSSGTAVNYATSTDGVHPGSYGHALAAAAYITAKTQIVP